MEKDKIMKILNSVENRTAYATSLKNAVRFHVASIHKMHFWSLFQYVFLTHVPVTSK
jgi:hypothetical protein